jgi:hypothetical protein
MKNVPITREQVSKLPKGFTVTEVFKSRRRKAQEKRQKRINDRREEWLYVQVVPYKIDGCADGKIVLTEPKKIIHKLPIRNKWMH